MRLQMKFKEVPRKKKKTCHVRVIAIVAFVFPNSRVKCDVAKKLAPSTCYSAFVRGLVFSYFIIFLVTFFIWVFVNRKTQHQVTLGAYHDFKFMKLWLILRIFT